MPAPDNDLRHQDAEVMEAYITGLT